MKSFFNVTELERVFDHIARFPPTAAETAPLEAALGRVTAADILSPESLPPFSRSTMDGYAARAANTFGASESSPAYLNVVGAVAMGESPGFKVGPGECARIATGGQIPAGADAVVMLEHAESLDEGTIEVYRSVAPGGNVIQAGEDMAEGDVAIPAGRRLRAQEIGLLAGLGIAEAPVRRRPVVGIISTGDEVVPADAAPGPGQIRDINTHTLSARLRELGCDPKAYGIVGDACEPIFDACARAVAECDMVLLSGGSSVGARDFTIEALSALPDATILVHGITISPGKPTILASVGEKAVWGLPGHVASAMVVFDQVVRPFLDQVAGVFPSGQSRRFPARARLRRNIASAQGRVDFVRVRLLEIDGALWADPILGKSGLISTLVKADGLVAIGMNTEGLDAEAVVSVIVP